MNLKPHNPFSVNGSSPCKHRFSTLQDAGLPQSRGEIVLLASLIHFSKPTTSRILARIGSSVDVGRKHDIPELRRGREELNGNQRAFLIHLRRTDNIHLDALLRSWIFENELGALGQSLGKNECE